MSVIGILWPLQHAIQSKSLEVVNWLLAYKGHAKFRSRVYSTQHPNEDRGCLLLKNYGAAFPSSVDSSSWYR